MIHHLDILVSLYFALKALGMRHIGGDYIMSTTADPQTPVIRCRRHDWKGAREIQRFSIVVLASN
jgi:hypothetical protein